MQPSNLPPSQLLQALHWRYATKSFDKTRRIPAETWSAIEESLILTASSFGLQPYKFVIVTDPAIKAQLVPHAWGQQQVADCSHLVVFATRTDITEAEIDRFLARISEVRGTPVESLNGYKGMMTGMLLSEGFKPQVATWAAKQAYIALGNLLTAAALLGVDACPMEGYVPAEFDRLLGFTGKGLTTAVCCPLGYRSATDKYASLPKVRLPKAELVQTI